ncbi:O-antigen ligase family protein [Endozoicomonas acroporae]|uniref:O-antigen ligase family protein n=1 Tax=Endozoicomonas acroporae TaxID=1701104 RepID=UPI003D7A3E80
MNSAGGYISQTYIWCLFPGLISFFIDLHRNGLAASIRGMTAGEKLIALMLLWIQVHPLLVSEGIDIGTVFNRVIKIAAYLYVVRTVVIHCKRPERLLLLAAGVATFFAAFTLIYQFGVLDRPLGVRALGIDGYRVDKLGLGNFTEGLSNPILAALYYGSFATILCGYMAVKPFYWQRRMPMIIAIVMLGVFILLTGSRGPLIAFVAMAGMSLLLCRYTWKWKAIFLLSVMAAISLIWLHDDILLQIDRVLADGFNCRFPIWEQAVNAISQKPVIGYGAFSDFKATCAGVTFEHPHNMMVNLLYHWGLPALAFYIAILGYILLTMKQLKPSSVRTIAIVLMVFGFVGMLTDTYSFLVRPNLQWLLYFLPISLYSGEYRKQLMATE